MILRLATTPALLLGRLRPDLAGFALADRVRFAGATLPYAAVAAVAVLYPLVASFVHRFGGPPAGGDILSQALNPTFDVVYTESLPFMVAAVVIGVLSPALGVVFMAVFIPTDLLASFDTSELRNNQFATWPVQAWVARAASLGLLWILVVEIPVRGRGIAARFGSILSAGAMLRLAVANALATALLAYAWSIVASLLIISVYTWTLLQQPLNRATDPLWYYWWAIAASAGIAGFVAGIWPRWVRRSADPAEAAAAGEAPGDGPRAGPPSLGRTLVRETLASLAFAALCGALMTGPAEALLVIGGALLAGPGMTLVLRALPAIGPLGALDGDARWVAATIGAAAVTVLITVALWDALDVTSDFGFAMAVVIVINVFRFIRDVGVGRTLAADDPVSAPASA